MGLRGPDRGPEVTSGDLISDITGTTGTSDYSGLTDAMGNPLFDEMGKPILGLWDLENLTDEQLEYMDYGYRDELGIEAGDIIDISAIENLEMPEDPIENPYVDPIEAPYVAPYVDPYSGSGTTDAYSLESIGFQQLQGAQKGGQNLTDLVNALYGTLREGGYYGTDAMSGNPAIDELHEAGGYGETLGGGSNIYDYLSGEWGGGLDVMMSQMEGQFGQGKVEDYFGNIKNPDYGLGSLTTEQMAQKEHYKGMQSLHGLLENLNIPGMMQGYRKDVGDVQSEIGSQLQGLLKARTIGSKAGRYGGIGSGGRSIGEGGRSKYMSDYYGLKEKGYEMETGLQKQLEEDLYSDVGQYMQLNRP